jgi:hypothetical protein
VRPIGDTTGVPFPCRYTEIGGGEKMYREEMKLQCWRLGSQVTASTSIRVRVLSVRISINVSNKAHALLFNLISVES